MVKVLANINDFFRRYKETNTYDMPVENLSQAIINHEYVIQDINTDNYEIKEFLFTLGCYKGETVTVISKLADNYVISVKDARYSIDKDLAEAIIV